MFEVLMVTTVSVDVTPCSVVPKYRRFRQTCVLHLQDVTLA
jgi:hypothetical protein